MSEYTKQRLQWLIEDYKGSGATTQDEANLAQLVLDLQCSVNYRRLTMKHLKSELLGAIKLKLESESSDSSSFEHLKGYVRGLEIAVESFKYYAQMAGKGLELESS